MLPPPHTHRFRVILAGVDFSRQSARALRYAVATARVAGGRVVAVHAVDPLMSAAAARAYADYPIVEETRAALERFVRRMLGSDQAAAIECTVVCGPARQVLVGEARRLHADVVVLGTNGRGGLSKSFFGSTAEAVLRRYSTGAVMVVPPRCGNPSDGWPAGSIVATVASGPHHRAMLSAAARTAHVFGAWLKIAAPPARPGRARWHPAPLIVLPQPAAARLRTFRQGSAAYEFVRRAAVPVIVVHTRGHIGHPEVRRPAA